MCAEKKTNEVLAQQEGLGSVSLCGCGTISLHVQAMTLRMDLKAFAQATAMMEEAMTLLEGKAEMMALDGTRVLLH